ncbi:NAD(P)-dependent alcohol dehydrogenase [Planococcus shenhongbingii]|uniref:NAD(P)-dependent alcohol dehydrogenase n=1 Tax=Planococcus shenhongbingii TaxID=3058398 RepID=UPI0026368B4E|nr:NAD(P)-dependent alcohol dehydrogenase [Planococcus sp. N016]WKA57058.1 NAD(P)-dependent alcohol dehydrogenase [Planococcus sp. N016]
MKIKAAVTPETGQAFEIKDVELPELGSKDVLIKVTASGICHTDVSGRDTGMVNPPAVLGHEGAGIVEEIGSEVTELQKGDHVVVSFASCGECDNCLANHPAHCRYYGDLNLNSHIDQDTNQLVARFFGQSSFATYSLVNQRNVVKIDKDMDLALAAPLGCGLQTGASSVLNVLKPEAGSSIAVFGVGAVGLSGIMAAKIAGCKHIIAIDLHENRLELAEELGATATIKSGKGVDVAEKIKEITGTGVQSVLDTTGVDVVIEQAILSLDTFGKIVTVVTDFNLSIPLEALALKGGSITGTSQGDATPQKFIPEMISYYKNGQFPYDRMVKFFEFDEINKAFEESENGSVIKPVLKMNH